MKQHYAANSSRWAQPLTFLTVRSVFLWTDQMIFRSLPQRHVLNQQCYAEIRGETRRKRSCSAATRTEHTHNRLTGWKKKQRGGNDEGGVERQISWLIYNTIVWFGGNRTHGSRCDGRPLLTSCRCTVDTDVWDFKHTRRTKCCTLIFQYNQELIVINKSCITEDCG